MNRVKKRWLALALIGACGLLLSLVLQVSSVLTPVLAENAFALSVMPVFGLLVLCFASLTMLVAAVRRRKREYLLYAGVYLLAIVFVQTTTLGTAFQLALSGLTVWGSLVVLGCRHCYSVT